MKVVANWKMYKTEKESLQFIDAILPHLQGREAYIAAPYPSLSALCKKTANSSISIGAQNMSQHLEGAYTGEVSALMLKEIGAKFVILGHSERRHFFKESEKDIFEKVLTALSQNILAIVCIGETLEEREGGQTKAVLRRQFEAAFQKLEISPKKIMIAYEPVWAIGTGRAATGEMASDAHGYIQRLLEEMVGKNLAQSFTILYGGSVKPENVGEFASMENIGGFLVGGASLDPTSFLSIINAAGV